MFEAIDSDNGKILKADCGFGLDDSKSFCSDAQMPRLVKTAIAVLTDRVRELFGIISAKEVKTYV